MARYHVHPETGEVSPCRTTVGTCPFGGEAGVNHYPTLEEARQAGEELLSQRHGLLPSPTTASAPPPRVRPRPQDYDVEGDENYFERRYEEARLKEERGYLPLSEGEKLWRAWQEKHPGLALTPVEGAPKQAKLYRRGRLTPGEYKHEVALYAAEADYYRPEGLPPRTGSLYASSDGKGLARWLTGVSLMDNAWEELEAHELTVDASQVKVFHVKTWEAYSWKGAHPERYWQSAMDLSRFRQVAEEEGWNTSEWEVLVPPEAVVNSKVLGKTSWEKVIPEDAHRREEVVRILDEVAKAKRREKQQEKRARERREKRKQQAGAPSF